jgi:hypothetical protein
MLNECGQARSDYATWAADTERLNLQPPNYGSIAAHGKCVSNVTGTVYPSGTGSADVKTRSGLKRRLRERRRAALSP